MNHNICCQFFVFLPVPPKTTNPCCHVIPGASIWNSKALFSCVFLASKYPAFCGFTRKKKWSKPASCQSSKYFSQGFWCARKGKVIISKTFIFCLNRLWFLVLQVRLKVLTWKKYYNNIRPKCVLFQKLISLAMFFQVTRNLWRDRYWNLLNVILCLWLVTSGVYTWIPFFVYFLNLEKEKSGE